MNYIQTFWSGPGVRTGEELYGFTGGWLSAEYHWMSWALSALQAHKIFGRVELVTDGPGAEMLAGVLGLPYSRVSTALDGMSARYPAGLWSMAKIYSYSLQREPFLHLDGFAAGVSEYRKGSFLLQGDAGQDKCEFFLFAVSF